MSNLTKVEFRDIGARLALKNKKIDEKLFSSGLHPSSDGCQVLAQELPKQVFR